jgi:diguanylate cyclase (GGDEF)-like protein
MTAKLWVFLLLFMPFMTMAKNESSVLLINSYHPQYRWTSELTRGVQDVMATSIQAENLYIEFMDERRFVDDLVFNAKLIDLLKHKYQHYQPDIIITSDDYAFNFILEHGDDLFPGKPIVFSGVNVFDPEILKGRSNITGIKEGMEIKGNLDLILKLQPEIKRIIMLGDTTGLGLRMVNRAKKIKSQWQDDPAKNKVTLEIWDQFTLEELNQNAANVDSDTAFLMLAIHKDIVGNYFSYWRDLPILTQHSKAPVYGMWGTLIIGNGGIGGLINNPYEHGRNAANIAVRILDGVPLNEIKIQDKSKYVPFFDYNVVKRFNIDLDLLPRDSTIINRPTSQYEQHVVLINSAIAFVIFLLAVILILVFNIKRRTTAQETLRQFNRKLESLVQQRTKDLDERNQELKAASERLQALAYTDVLTGLANRRAGCSDLSGYIQRYKQAHRPLAVAILDVDFFKRINDTFGHAVGDEVLCGIAQTLKDTIRPSDRVYRWGGEEFLVVFPNTPSDFSTAVCQRLGKSITQINMRDVGTITASIGVANFVKGDTFESILLRADEALYAAKNKGRNQVVVGGDVSDC